MESFITNGVPKPEISSRHFRGLELPTSKVRHLVKCRAPKLHRVVKVVMLYMSCRLGPQKKDMEALRSASSSTQMHKIRSEGRSAAWSAVAAGCVSSRSSMKLPSGTTARGMGLESTRAYWGRSREGVRRRLVPWLVSVSNAFCMDLRNPG